MYLNANVPIVECYIRNNFLRNQQDSFDTYSYCCIFGVTSLPKQTPLFTCMTMDGCLWSKAPISAFCSRENVKEQPLTDLCLWDSFSYNISVTTYAQLAGAKVKYIQRDGKEQLGTYCFTLDWTSGDYNELDFGYSSLPDQAKVAHFLKLDNGNFSLSPNSRLRVFDSNFGVNWNNPPDIHRLVNTHTWSCETDHRWTTVDKKEEGEFDYDYVNTEKKND